MRNFVVSKLSNKNENFVTKTKNQNENNNPKTMKRKEYRRPAMTVVSVRQQGCLMGMSGGRQSYGTANSSVNQSELDENGIWNWN